MDEAGKELPQQAPVNTEVSPVKQEAGILSRIRRIFGSEKENTTPPQSQPKTEAQLLAERGEHQAHLDSVAAWNQESPHPADKKIISETSAKIEGIDAELRKIQEAKLPTPPTTTPETPPPSITQIPVAQPETIVKPTEPIEQPKAA